MNKRNILSLFVAGALLGGLSVTFTGCIDNDEPQGVLELRQAKAALLNAKTAIAAAEAQKAQAEAQLVLAQAETEKAQAQIVLLKGQAEAAVTQAEADKIQAEIEIVKAQAQEALYKAEEARASMEQKVNEAEIEIKKALLDFEKDKQGYLQTYYSAYQTVLNEYNEAYAEYIEDRYVYLNTIADTFADDYKIEYELNQAVNFAQNQLDAANWNIEYLNAALEQAQTLEPSDLEAKKDSIIEVLHGIDQEIKNIELARAEAEYENHEEIEKKDQLLADFNNAVNNSKVNVAAVTYEFPQEFVVAGFQGKVTLLPATLSFGVTNNNGNIAVDNGYNDAIATLQNMQTQINNALLDGNDLAWAAAEVTTLKKELTSYEDAYKKDLAAWEEAVKVYNSGDPDVKNFNDYAKVTDALTAYNTTVTTLNEGIARYNAADKALTDANAALAEAKKVTINEAEQNRAEARAKALEEYNKAVDAANKGISSEITSAEKDVVNAQNEVAAKEQQVVAAQAKLDAYSGTDKDEIASLAEGVATAKADLKTAETALAAAQKALTNLEDSKTQQATLDQAIADANATLQAAYYEAEQAYADAIATQTGDENDYQVADKEKIAAAQKVADDAEAYLALVNDTVYKGYNDKDGKAVKSLSAQRAEALTALNAQINALSSEISTFGENEGQIAIKDKDGNYIELAESQLTITAAQAKQNVILKSDQLYGLGAYGDKVSDDQYGIPVEQLIALTQDDIDDILAKYQGLASYNYGNAYKWFGTYGKYLAAQYEIAKLEALNGNPDVIEEVNTLVTETIASLASQKDELIASVKEAQTAYLEQQAVVDAIEKEFDDQKFEVEVKQAGLNKILSALYVAIGSAKDSAATLSSQKSIDDYIANLQSQLIAQQNDMPLLSYNLELAQKTLEGHQTAEINSTDAMTAIIELDESNLEYLKEKLDAAKAQLDAAIAYLESLE